MTGSHKNH